MTSHLKKVIVLVKQQAARVYSWQRQTFHLDSCKLTAKASRSPWPLWISCRDNFFFFLTPERNKYKTNKTELTAETFILINITPQRNKHKKQQDCENSWTSRSICLSTLNEEYLFEYLEWGVFVRVHFIKIIVWVPWMRSICSSTFYKSNRLNILNEELLSIFYRGIWVHFIWVFDWVL